MEEKSNRKLPVNEKLKIQNQGGKRGRERKKKMGNRKRKSC